MVVPSPIDTAVSNGFGAIPTFVGTHAPEIVLAALAVASVAFVVGWLHRLLGR